ncbi:MAG: helix-turn-helix domain-containing protein [Synergistaceae bacterium]|jgi:transcriptional regulator with XRE-family HTH domain|nr:helix-turn-helix domain-containing protein [Synergistaceae bacterium]
MDITGQRIKKLRNNLGVTQVQLSVKLGVANDTVSRWERGALKISRDNLISLAALLKTSVSFLLGETDDPLPSRSQKSVRDHESNIVDKPAPTTGEPEVVFEYDDGNRKIRLMFSKDATGERIEDVITRSLSAVPDLKCGKDHNRPAQELVSNGDAAESISEELSNS